jgi:hypothetical protein
MRHSRTRRPNSNWGLRIADWGLGNGHQVALLIVSVLWMASVGCTLPPAQRGLTIWAASGDEEVLLDTPPSLENDVYSATRGEVRLQAALNETVALQVCLRTTAPPAGPFDMWISDFGGPAERLPAEAVATIYRAHYTRVDRFRAWYADAPRSHSGPVAAQPTLFPDILVPWEAPRGGGPLTLAEPRTEFAWVDLHVPATATPGEYQGRLEVRRTSDQKPAWACAVWLRVLPVALPDRRNLPVICRVDPRDLLTTHLHWPRAAAEDTRLMPDVPSHFAAVRLVGETMRLLQAHRTTPVLWASFPKFFLVGERTVEVQWDEYDRLVAPWLDGSAFPDHVRLETWPIPASLDYPSAERNGGLDTPEYARLLTAYLAECRRHFAERGWLERAVLRMCPPEPLAPAAVAHLERLTRLVQQSESALPVVAHLPAQSLRGLGWQDAPAIDLPGVSIFCPPAMWYEPDVMQRQQEQGRHTWFMPDFPPYSGSLAVEAPANDPRVLGWQAFRYGVQGLWIEHATEFGASTPASTALEPWAGPGLIYPADEYGLRDRPVPSLRLKRLRRGLQDYELLKLLEDNGKRLLAQKLAEQIVRWAFTEACGDNLVSCKEAGWPRQSTVLRLARNLMLQELSGQFDPDPAARQRQIASLTQWGRMMSQAERVGVHVDGVRLAAGTQNLRAHVLASAVNSANRPLQGHWSLPKPPPDWQQVRPVITHLEAGARRSATIELNLAGLAYNIDGIYPFDLAFDTAALGSVRVPARLAVAVCLPLDDSPLVDGRLDDWPLASNNIAGDFRLCREPAGPGAAHPDLPALPTRAFFVMDETTLYVAVRCTSQPGEPPLWRADNTVPIDGAVPWEQDVVEILIDPRAAITGTSSDLYCLQIKPSGLLVARKGCRTEPPMGTSDPWPCAARVAVNVQRDDWIVELALPLSAFGAEARRNRVWGLNVTRLDARRGEYSSWSGARDYCYRPQSLGNLIMLWP